MFSPSQKEELIKKIRKESQRERLEHVYWRWPLVIAAMAVFLIEIFIRRIVKKQE